MINKAFSRVFDFLASLELAVSLIVVLALAFAAGTVYESLYDAKVAKAVIYGAWWMNILLVLFMLNVTAAALSRWPWKKHHIGFLVTHLGIIILLAGSIVTKFSGIDGIMALRQNETSNWVELDGNLLNVYRAIEGKTYDLVLSEELPYNDYRRLSEPRIFPLEAKSHNRSISSEQAKVPALILDQYWPKAERQVDARVVGSGYPAIRFRLSGSRANLSEWLFLTGKETSSADLGPAIVQFRKGVPPVRKHPKNTLYIYYEEAKPDVLLAATFRKDSDTRELLGELPLNKSKPVGWMDFNIMVLNHHQSAMPKLYYFPLEKRTPGMGMAGPVEEVIRVRIGEEDSWLALGSSAQIAHEDAVYYVQFVPRRVDIGFGMTLKEFRIKYYDGSRKPMAYESAIEAFGDEHLIAMNEPYKAEGFTFYQSSFTEDEEGNPVYSVLSVNRDPGRWIKYFGSLMLCLGILLMFYFKPIYSGNNRFLQNLGKAND